VSNLCFIKNLFLSLGDICSFMLASDAGAVDPK